jgi:hypothetical protein
MRGAILPLPQYAYMAWCSVKAQGKRLPFTFTLHPLSKWQTLYNGALSA